MTREDIIRMAREAGLVVTPPSYGYTESYHFAGFEQAVDRFAELVRADEREACADLCDEYDGWIAKRIRARGTND